jgi:hypothetical protein
VVLGLCPDVCFRGDYRSGARLKAGLDVLVIPGEIALIAIANKARPGEIVEFAGINNELCRNAKCSKSLVHLFAADQRHVEQRHFLQADQFLPSWPATAVR